MNVPIWSVTTVFLIQCTALRAHAQPIDWVAPINGNWGMGANWDSGNIPDQAFEHASLGFQSAYMVSTQASFVIGSLSISNPLVTLNIGAGSTHILFGDINNDGLIVINPSGSTNDSIIQFQLPAALNGSGTIRLNGQASPQDAQLDTSAYSLTQGSEHSIEGSGLLKGNILNEGRIAATGQGGAPLNLAATIIQTGDGRIIAESSDIRMNNNMLIEGGSLNSLNGHRFLANGNASTLRNVHNTGNIDIGGSNRELRIRDAFVNDGLVRLNVNANVADSSIQFENSMTIYGSGTIQMQASTTDSHDCRLYAALDKVLTNGPNHTIVGSGTVGGNGGTINNIGLIYANDPDHQLNLAGKHIGDGRYVAGDGSMIKTSPYFGDEVTIDGITFDTEGSGIIVLNSVHNQYHNITNLGNMLIDEHLCRSFLDGDIVNNGTMSIRTYLHSLEPTMFSGSGTLDLLPVSTLTNANEHPMVNSSGHTIIGRSTHILGAFTNHGTIIALPGFAVRLSGNHNPGNGLYLAQGGRFLLRGATLTDVVFETQEGGSIQAEDSSRLIDCTINGTTLIDQPISAFHFSGTLTNNGILKIYSEEPNVSPTLRFIENCTILGTGVIELSATQENRTAGIDVNNGFVCTIGVDQSIIGHGNLLGEIIVNGAISPEGYPPEFTVDQLTLTDTSILNLELGIIAGNYYDRIIVDEGGSIFLDGSLAVQIADGFTPSLGNSWDLISGSQINGEFDMITTPPAPEGYVYRVYSEDDRFWMVLTCPADLNGDLIINFFDISLFLEAFVAFDPDVDLNGDGIWNFFDISVFLQLFDSDCI